MATNAPPSLSTYLSTLRAACGKLASLSLRIAPGLPAAALAGLAIMCLAWSCEHRARQREAAEAKQVKKQAAEAISRLQQQAAGAVRDAKQSTQAARELETQRQQLERQAEGLRQSLELLRNQEQARSSEVATLTTTEVVKRLSSRLGPEGIGTGEQGTGNREQGTGQQATLNPLTRPAPAGVGNADQRTINPLTRPAPAGESAVAGHPLPQGGEGKNTAGGEGTRQDPSAHLPTSPSAALPAGSEGTRQDPSAHLPTSPSAALPAGGEGNSTSQAALMLTDQGVRQVETAFVQLASCRQENQVQSQQVSNCEQREKLSSALQAQQAATIAKLNAALADKDKILAQSEAAHRAELKAARGTWRTRLYHAAEIFAGGFVAGVLVR